jgi:hypothetical protein
MTQFKGRGLIQITGRNTGKSITSQMFMLPKAPAPTIKWQRLPGLKLQAYTDDIAPRGFERGLQESDMDPVQAWSQECNCGTRMSFNIWKFKNEKQITMFLIRWSQ